MIRLPMIALVVNFAILSTLASAADKPSYFTTCSVKDGKATGYVNFEKDTSKSFSGKVYFTTYDVDGKQLDRTWTLAIVIAVLETSEKVEELTVDANVKSCALDISEAIGYPPAANAPEVKIQHGTNNTKNNDLSYTTSCVIKDQKAVGYFNLEKPYSHSFSGKVYFYMYDEDGKQVARDWTLVVVIATGGGEKVGSVSAPKAAKTCRLDVTEALNR